MIWYPGKIIFSKVRRIWEASRFLSFYYLLARNFAFFSSLRTTWCTQEPVSSTIQSRMHRSTGEFLLNAFDPTRATQSRFKRVCMRTTLKFKSAFQGQHEHVFFKDSFPRVSQPHFLQRLCGSSKFMHNIGFQYLCMKFDRKMLVSLIYGKWAFQEYKTEFQESDNWISIVKIFMKWTEHVVPLFFREINGLFMFNSLCSFAWNFEVQNMDTTCAW